jgi:hypothetical protein
MVLAQKHLFLGSAQGGDLKLRALQQADALPGLIWFRAQIVRKAWQKERIERPLVVMHGLGGLTGAVILLLLVAGNWGQMQDAIDHRRWFLLPLLLLTLTASLASGAILLWSPAKR